MRIKLCLTLIAIFCLLILSACNRSAPPARRALSSVIVVDVPSGMKNSEPDPAIAREESLIVSVRGDEYFVGGERFSGSSAPTMFQEYLEKQIKGAHGQTVYFQAGNNERYEYVIKGIDVIRQAGSPSLALIVRPQGQSELQQFKVEVAPKPDPEAAYKPNPLSLEVVLSADGKLTLNKTEQGTVLETARFASTLNDTLKARSGLDKTVTILGNWSSEYGHIVRAIDAAKGAGATPIVLTIDGLSNSKVK